MMIYWKPVLFILISLVIAWFSKASLRSSRVHGFYRFFAFEADLGLVMLNLNYWFDHPFSLWQIISWLLLVASLFLVLHGFYLLRIVGRPQGSFENTSRLVQVGAYRFIRHPLYASLLFLAWGVFFKMPSLAGLAMVGVASGFLFTTARVEEKENLEKFGSSYAGYMKKTSMFVPFLF
jgi:protein-S-isoprenylcysteine O-methyltransferase Ste14